MRSLVFFLLVMMCSVRLWAADLASHNSDQPVEISSERLEVLQKQQQAVFTGKVEAVQGTMRLRSEKMVVHYKDKATKNQSGSSNSVSRIDVFENVFLATPEETASGTKGVYHVDKGIVKLDGNVVVTKGKNVVKGEHLVYNLKTGKSELVSGKQGSGAKKGRVRGVFVPESKDKKQ